MFIKLPILSTGVDAKQFTVTYYVNVDNIISFDGARDSRTRIILSGREAFLLCDYSVEEMLLAVEGKPVPKRPGKSPTSGTDDDLAQVAK